ncbi:hypothetical protein EV175_001243, partial [Coemansia sp. RSA 1933]
MGSDHGQNEQQDGHISLGMYSYTDVPYRGSGMTVHDKPTIGGNEFFYNDGLKHKMWEDEDALVPVNRPFVESFGTIPTN